MRRATSRRPDIRRRGVRKPADARDLARTDFRSRRRSGGFRGRGSSVTVITGATPAAGDEATSGAAVALPDASESAFSSDTGPSTSRLPASARPAPKPRHAQDRPHQLCGPVDDRRRDPVQAAHGQVRSARTGSKVSADMPGPEIGAGQGDAAGCGAQSGPASSAWARSGGVREHRGRAGPADPRDGGVRQPRRSVARSAPGRTGREALDPLPQRLPGPDDSGPRPVSRLHEAADRADSGVSDEQY